MLRSLANGRVSDGQTWALAECVWWPWNGKLSFSFCFSSHGELAKLEAFKNKQANQTRVWGGAVSVHPLWERGWDGSVFAVLALDTATPHGRRVPGHTNITPPLPLLASEWFSEQSPRERSARWTAGLAALSHLCTIRTSAACFSPAFGSPKRLSFLSLRISLYHPRDVQNKMHSTVATFQTTTKRGISNRKRISRLFLDINILRRRDLDDFLHFI